MEVAETMDWREPRAQRMQDRLDWPVVVAALLAIPIIVIEEPDFGDPWGTVATVLNWVTWSVFLAER